MHKNNPTKRNLALHQTGETNYKISISGCFVVFNELGGRVSVSPSAVSISMRRAREKLREKVNLG